MVPKCKEGIQVGKGGRETSAVQPSSASRAGCEVSRIRGFEVDMPRPGTGLAWLDGNSREMSEVQIRFVGRRLLETPEGNAKKKNIMNPESCWVVPSRS
jgi:hypothetical protein